MNPLPQDPGPIGIFDSGFGGLTVLKAIRERLPQYDYLYLGDNARAPYGTRSFECVYDFTLQAVRHLFDQGCHLVILACNTASAKALRTIQQTDLPGLDPARRVLGVIRPTTELLGHMSSTGHVGVVATRGTILSRSYEIECAKLWPDITLQPHACPMWVPLVENCVTDTPGADYFVREDLKALIEADPLIDTIILGCTHYPILLPTIRRILAAGVHPLQRSDIKICPQGNIVAESLDNYLTRHPEIREKCTTSGTISYLTTDQPDRFSHMATMFMETAVEASPCRL